MAENSILAVDFGNVHTRALLIDLVEGVYRMVARAEERTTGGFPIADVGVGFRRAVRGLGANSGRQLINREGTLITPEQPDRSGVDAFVATASIGRPLRTVLIGLMPEMSIASALRAAAGTYVEIVDVLSLYDQRTPQEQLNAIILADPDLIFIAGGTEEGARAPVLAMAGITRMALRLMSSRASVLYAGNSALAVPIHELFEGVTTVFIAENVRPALGDESIEGAQVQLASAFDSFTERRGLGFDEVGFMSQVGVLPTAQSYHTIVGYLGQTVKPGGVLAVDIGSATSTMSAALKGHVATSIRTDIGLGHSARTLLDAVGLEAVRAWLPFFASDNEIVAYALNKSVRPATIPADQRSLYLEHAFLRAAMIGLLHAARPTWAVSHALDNLNEPLPYFERIIGAGAGVTGTGRPGLTAMLLLDSLQPHGVISLQADSGALIPALGALARVNPEAVVQVLDSNSLENLCTCVSLSGIPRVGHAAARVTITTEAGQQEKFTVEGGTLVVYPLSLGIRAHVRVAVSRGLNVGGKGRLRLEIDGGTAGLVIDARGRPLPLANTLKGLAAQIPAWYAQATGDPAFEIPPEWLAPSAEKPVSSAPDQRRGQPVPEPMIPGEDDAGEAPSGGRGLFGRRAKAPAPQDEEENDLRNLLS